MILTKNGKLIALDENDQKIIYDLLNQRGTRIKYSYSSLSDTHSLLIVNAKNKEVGSLVGEAVLTINKLISLSEHKEGMKLSEFIKLYCPTYSGQ